MPDIEKVKGALTEDIERLRRLWDEGKASGPAEPFDIERTITAAKARRTKAGG